MMKSSEYLTFDNKPYHTTYLKTRFGNTKLRKVVLVPINDDEEYVFSSTLEASMWYKENAQTTASVPNISNMLLRTAKGERKHLGSFFVFIEGINL